MLFMLLRTWESCYRGDTIASLSNNWTSCWSLLFSCGLIDCSIHVSDTQRYPVIRYAEIRTVNVNKVRLGGWLPVDPEHALLYIS